MPMEEHAYSMLVVSSTDNFNHAVAAMLPKASFQPVINVSTVTRARRTVAERNFDFVIINAPVGGDLGMHFAIDCSISHHALVLLLVPNEIHGDVYSKVAEHGVFTLQKPMNKATMENALRWLLTAKRKLSGAETKSTKMEDKMEEIRLVNKAKWLLISNEGLLEPEAHRFLEKEAMDRCVTKRVVAAEIIRKYS
ncbi:MAG: ANTAR domain-containing protein [Ruminococcaceae bacterium]|nr:ANTAR domain-containing protein [Oscillospiraceae bacterium]